ncbi:MAG: Fpg/Nei family DNA glycosylase [Solirubrobacterales bacterium]
MPEGDVIHRTAARLEAGLAGTRIVEAASPNPRAGIGAVARRFVGDQVHFVEARGKHLLIHFGGGDVVHNHLGMKGRWRVEDREGPHSGAASGRSQDRGSKWIPWLVLETSEAVAVQTGGSRMRILSEASVRRDPQLARLGPDVLKAGFDPGRGVRALRGARPEEQIGVALLNQALLSGIGNIFRCEGCFGAGVSPWRRLAELSDAELTAIVSEITELMWASLSGDRPDRRVYRRSGRPCPRCGTAVSSRPQGDAARTTYWCSGCQS